MRFENWVKKVEQVRTSPRKQWQFLIATDGAAAMIGSLKGAAAKLRQQLNCPINTHCCSHRLCTLFHHSPTLDEKLRKAQLADGLSTIATILPSRTRLFNESSRMEVHCRRNQFKSFFTVASQSHDLTGWVHGVSYSDNRLSEIRGEGE
ncbi:hypothetical protein BLNAU_15391 [Blattamonas nauphoetae]|uniref:DUF4371 domain-containing protein n=1 Tax=Blattamonas nauphoetae TaxID=2049346 RepID=A0ABQ9XE34_9EUKA|nr:hypothetical protein BLNAU_15391 [Blattamonas nauphoetae]